ncbi:NAD(P)H-hydrate repair Nnr-like enzyme with NAD(P)H-hydrate dehydratase domain [Streptococcus saliviloxodontae]|uniref:NAD(P)H-hydrate repair Nnr-like enzyme with NAD(P)H-hydrate dehydratase domain n=1 Tax=Streptococcus saliviloxodontae TaxID=1349416 RepID=A0ABS2PP90_9STRE|nr:NAD(P)H-hydrate repair Nnr-like enzyme with NAD(P)H-hydrate dehydratase domain [Streptococcus saliviloxodontae]
MTNGRKELELTNTLVLTPHQKEWERLSGLAIQEQTSLATETKLKDFPFNTILVAKSQATKVFSREKEVAIGVGGPYQATGGMGDTLCGMIAGFLAQFTQSETFDVVFSATWLHSAIADQLSETAYLVLPTQISQAIPAWMKCISKGELPQSNPL